MVLLVLLFAVFALCGLLALMVARKSRAVPRPEKLALASILLTPCRCCQEFVPLDAPFCFHCGGALHRRKLLASQREDFSPEPVSKQQK